MSKPLRIVLAVCVFTVLVAKIYLLSTEDSRRERAMNENLNRMIEMDQALKEAKSSLPAVTQGQSMMLRILAVADEHPQEVLQADSLFELLKVTSNDINSLTDSLVKLEETDERQAAALMSPAKKKLLRDRLIAIHDLADKAMAASARTPGIEGALTELAQVKQQNWEKTTFKNMPPFPVITILNAYKSACEQVVLAALTDIMNRV